MALRQNNSNCTDKSPVSCKGFGKFGTTQNVSDAVGSPNINFTGGPGINDFIFCWGNMLKGRKPITSQLQGLQKPLTSLGTWVHSTKQQPQEVLYIQRAAEFSIFEMHSQLQPPPGDSQCIIKALRSYRISKSTVLANFF